MSEEKNSTDKRFENKNKSFSNNKSNDGGQKKYNKYKRFPRRKVCAMCADKKLVLDYKDASSLRKFIAENGKILPSRQTGTCSKHQRVIARTVKRARNVGVLPFAGE